MKPEPLKNKTFMDDNNGFPLSIDRFADFEKRRKKSFSYTNDIKSAVEWLRGEDNTSLMRAINVLTGCGYKHIAIELSQEINKNKNEAFEDVVKKH